MGSRTGLREDSPTHLDLTVSALPQCPIIPGYVK